MEPDNNQIILQLFATFLDQQSTLRDLARNDLLLIEAIQLDASPEALRDAASTVRATLYSVDEVGDRIRRLAEQVQRSIIARLGRTPLFGLLLAVSCGSLSARYGTLCQMHNHEVSRCATLPSPCHSLACDRTSTANWPPRNGHFAAYGCLL
jgi:hypothetical protein